MRRIAIVAVLVVGAAVLAWWLWPADDAGVPEDVAAAPDAVPPAIADVAPPPEKMNAILSQPVRAEGGAGTLRGKVVAHGQPVAGATVTATRADAEESLSELGCHCDNVCGQKLLECGCGEASEQIKELVAERRGEVVPVGRAVTGADGTFALTQLEPGKVALWADREALGTALVRDVAVGGPEVTLTLGDGIHLKGRMSIDGAPAKGGAWVTAIHVEQSRFFDVLTQHDGTFSLGPLPRGRYSVIGGAPGAMSGHLHVRKDTPTEKLELTLYSPRTVRGRVTLGDAPAAGVKVTANGNHRTREAISASDGTVQFTGLRPGDYELSALKGTLRADATVDVPRKGVAKDAVLALGEAAQLSVSVRSGAGPVAGAKVELHSMGKEANATTDAEGRIALSVFSGKGANLYVHAEGFVMHRAHVDLEEGETTHVDVTLERAVTISGRVVTEDGMPVDGADVGVRLEKAPDPKVDPDEEVEIGSSEVFAKTADGGLFVVEKVERGMYSVMASHSEYRAVEAKVQAPADGVVLTLKQGLVLEGEVFDAAGKPAAAKVEVWTDDRRRQATHEASAGVDGKFKVKGLGDGKQWIRAIGEAGKVTQNVTVAARGPTFVRLVLEPHFTITGTVTTVDGTPVPDVFLWVRSETHRGRGQSDADGAFTIEDLKEGEYSIEIHARAHALAEPVKAKAGARNVAVKVRPNAKVRGRVVDDKGAPIPQFTVDYDDIEDEGGRFEVALSPRSSTVQISVDGHPAVRKKVVLRDGAADLGDIVFGGRSLRVRTMRDGKPLEGSDLWLVKDWGSLGREPLTYTAADGWATLRGLPVSGAVILANHPTHRPKQVAVGDGQTEVVVEMDPGATVTVKTVDAAGTPVQAFVHVQIKADGHSLTNTTNKAGVLSLTGMSSGPVTLVATRMGTEGDRLRGTGERATRTVDVPESGELPVTLTLTKGPIALELTVAKPAGSWADAWVVLLPEGTPMPTNRVEYSRVSGSGELERLSAAGTATFRGTTAGRRVVLVLLLQQSDRVGVMYGASIDVGPEPQQQRSVPAPAPNALIRFTDDDGL